MTPKHTIAIFNSDIISRFIELYRNRRQNMMSQRRIIVLNISKVLMRLLAVSSYESRPTYSAMYTI